MSTTAGELRGGTCREVEGQPAGAAITMGPGAPTVYWPWLRRFWSLWLASDARNDAWIR